MSNVDELLDKWREKFKRGFLRFVILRMFCEKDEENEFKILNGMVIREKIARQTNENWIPSPGSIYPVLAEMESDGLIERVSRDETKKSKWYRITPLGLNLVTLLRKDTMAFRHGDEIFTNPVLFEQFKQQFRLLHQQASIDELERLHHRFSMLALLTKELIEEKKKLRS